MGVNLIYASLTLVFLNILLWLKANVFVRLLSNFAASNSKKVYKLNVHGNGRQQRSLVFFYRSCGSAFGTRIHTPSCRNGNVRHERTRLRDLICGPFSMTANATHVVSCVHDAQSF